MSKNSNVKMMYFYEYTETPEHTWIEYMLDDQDWFRDKMDTLFFSQDSNPDLHLKFNKLIGVDESYGQSLIDSEEWWQKLYDFFHLRSGYTLAGFLWIGECVDGLVEIINQETSSES